MNERIKDKIGEIEKYLAELEEFIPSNFKDYINDVKTKSACERHAEKIIEAIVDLAFLVIKDKKLELPESDTQAFDIMARSNIISIRLAKKLQDAKSMRNILAHEYGEVNDEIVFHAIREELEKDVNEFIKEIKR